GGAATDEAIGSELAGSCGIFSPQSGVEISGGTITATGGTAPYSFGICANGGITVNGGHVIAETKATSETHIALNAAPALPANYWWRTADTDEFTTSDDSKYVYSDTHTYVEITEPTCVTFDPNGGVVDPTGAITDIFGRLTNLPTPTRSGRYRFDGWYTAAEGGIMVTTETVFTEDATIYAHWSYNGGSGGGGGGTTRYTVKFETNGGSKVSSKTVTRNTAVAEPTAPTKDGYTFDGWYSDKELKTSYDFSAKVTKSFTLYAKWTEKETEPDKPTEPVEPTEPTDPEWENLFTDVSENDWFYGNVKFANENGLMCGTTNTNFAPNEPLTRAMLVTVIYRAEGEPAVNKSIPFSDVDTNAYYTSAVIWAQQNGIVNGVTENKFAPDENINREQIATIMYRYAQYKGYDISVGENTNILSYTDYKEISEYAVSAMQYVVGSGLMKGKTESTINPLDNATRAEVAAILQRFIESNK
ncbi:MAG: S-layer homology domain-containing protein, partial [Clostridia bacterium]|nr:S-layer homology domain-containing protein [Clostridia bacterium]